MLIQRLALTVTDGQLHERALTVKGSAATRCLEPPSSATCIAYDLNAQRLAVGSEHGEVFSLYKIRHVFIDRSGIASTRAAFSSIKNNMLFVAFSDHSIRCYDVHKNICLGILREHKTSVLHLEPRPNAPEFMSVASDGLILWDTRKLARKKSLGGGPHGLAHASYSPDGDSLIALFHNGSISVWSASTFAHLRTFGPIVGGAGVARLISMQSTFCTSQDGGLLVSGGPQLPFLLVYNLMTGSLLYTISLPNQPHSSYEGVMGKLIFLPDSSTVSAMFVDGTVKFINVNSASVAGELPLFSPNLRPDCVFEMDIRGNHLAHLADGKVFLHDLGSMRKVGFLAVELRKIDPSDLENAATSLPLVAPSSRDKVIDKAIKRPKAIIQDAPPRRGSQKDQDGSSNSDMSLPRLRAMLEAFGEYPSRYRLAIWDRLLVLPRNQLAFTGLVNKGQHSCCKALMDSPIVSSIGKPLGNRLVQQISLLAHWSPLFSSLVTGEVGFIPRMVFPFVKLFASSVGEGGGGAPMPSETCFELLATLLSGFTRGWFDRYPHPPVGILVRVQDLIKYHDASLYEHLSNVLGAEQGGFGGILWGHLSSLMSEALDKPSWLRLFDHAFTSNKPDFLYCALASYFVTLRDLILKHDTARRLLTYLSSPPPLDVSSLIHTSYLLLAKTPVELLPGGGKSIDPLPQSSVYAEMKDAPLGAVQLYVQERDKILDAEEALAKRRRVVSELEVRTRATAFQAASLEQERAQLAALQAERREQMRRAEAQLLARASRLDDNAKLEQLKQIHLVESAYQRHLVLMREEWQKELEMLRADIRHKQEVMSVQARSKEEEEAIKGLEFQARQRMKELQQEAIRTAMQASLRSEVDAHLNEAESKARTRAKQWEAEDEARRVRMEYEEARALELARQAEELSAHDATRKELIQASINAEDEAVKASVQRRLRMLSEDQILITSRAKHIESSQIQARSKAEEAALQVQAAKDLSWFEAEVRRREIVLAGDQGKLDSVMEDSRRAVLDKESQMRFISGQAALLERRRELEQQNLIEETEARRVLERHALMRSRQVQLELQAKAKAEDALIQLELARKASEMSIVSEMRREALASGSGSGGTKENDIEHIQAKIAAAESQEMLEMTKRHEESLAALKSERDFKVQKISQVLEGPKASASPASFHHHPRLQSFSRVFPEPTEMDVLRALDKMRTQERVRGQIEAGMNQSTSSSQSSVGSSAKNSIKGALKAFNDADSVYQSSDSSVVSGMVFPSPSRLPLLPFSGLSSDFNPLRSMRHGDSSTGSDSLPRGSHSSRADETRPLMVQQPRLQSDLPMAHPLPMAHLLPPLPLIPGGTRHTSDGSISTEEIPLMDQHNGRERSFNPPDRTPLLHSSHKQYSISHEQEKEEEGRYRLVASVDTPLSELSDVSDIDGLISRMRRVLDVGSSIETDQPSIFGQERRLAWDDSS